MKSIDKILEINSQRSQWTGANGQLKRYFFEKIMPIFNESIELTNSPVPIIDFEDIEDEILHTGAVSVMAVLMGGYEYEYYLQDVISIYNNYFSLTEDVDVNIIVADIFSNEFLTVNIHKLATNNNFFEHIVSVFFKKLSLLDFSDCPPLDNLPHEDHDDNYFDNGRVRICFEEKSVDAIVQRKLQIKICKDGMYKAIMDLMFSFEKNYTPSHYITIKKICYDSIEREFKLLSLDSLLSDDLDALLNRYKYREAMTKTRNHFGRITYLLTYIATCDDEMIKFKCKIVVEYFLIKLSRKLRIPIKQAVYTVVCSYKSKEVTFKDMVEPLKEYAIFKHSSVFSSW